MGDQKEKIEELTTINFTISKCPMKIFKRFMEFCKNETNNNYSFGLKLLLDGIDSNIKEVVLYEQYMELKQRVSEIENKEQKQKAVPKTMGSANKDKGE
jgi:hypothetical protein